MRIEKLVKTNFFKMSVVIVALIFMVISTRPTTQAVYSPSSVCFAALTASNMDEAVCRSTLSETKERCVVNYNPSTFLGIQTGEDYCVNCVPNEGFAIRGTECCTGFSDATELQTANKQPLRLCRQPLPDEIEGSCNNAETSIAKIVLYPDMVSNCKTAYTLTLLGGLLLVVIIVGFFF